VILRATKFERLAKQRERSQLDRDRRKAGRVPDRDDIARVALRWLIVTAQAFGDDRKQLRLEGLILTELARQGFNEQASERVLEGLVDKYTKEKWDFFPKVHLRASDPE
jgi:hypothetical protein